MTEIGATTRVSGAVLAVILGVGRRRIEQLTASGTLVRGPDKKFELGEAVQSYVVSVRRDPEERKSAPPA